MNKHYFSTILALGMLISAPFLVSAVSAQEQETLTVATVNGAPISIDLVGNVINDLPEELRRQPLSTYYDRVVNTIINARLTAEQAIKEGIDNDPLIKELIEQERNRILGDVWLSRIVQPQINDAMVEEEYNALVADTESRTEVSASHILVATEAEAQTVIDRLDNGEDFAALAEEVSTGPSSANGGSLGYFGRGAMVPDFENASFGLAAGTYTQSPVETQFGWHVIKIEDKRVAQPPSLDAAREAIIRELSARHAGTILTELRNAATIERLSLEEVIERQQNQQSNSN